MGLTSHTILIDSREKRPLGFPPRLEIYDRSKLPTSDAPTRMVELRTRVSQLPTADYALEGQTHLALIERKGSLEELQKNLATVEGRRRFLNECHRLTSECSHPWIFLEGTPLELTRSVRDRERTNPAFVRDLLLDVLAEHRISLMLLPCSTTAHRRAAAEWVAATLIAGASPCRVNPERPSAPPNSKSS